MGILNSKGEFLLNLDPDDELLGYDSLKYLYETAKKIRLILFYFLLKKITLL